MTDAPRAPADRQRWSASDTISLTVVTGLAAAIRCIRLAEPPFIYSDELFYAREACIYVYQSPATCGIPTDAISAHPPLGKWLISLGIRLLGWEPIGWRIAGVVAGIVTVALVYVLARRIIGSTRGATFAAGLLAIDFLHVVQSRIAMLDVFLTLFVLTSFTCLAIDRVRYDARGRGGVVSAALRRPWLLAAGVAAGAAMATKWVGALALLGIVVLSCVWTSRQSPEGPWVTGLKRALRAQWPAMAAAFVVAPAVTYIASSAPSVDGSVVTAPWARGSWARSFARVQRDMLTFHRESAEIRYLGTTHPYVSPAWSWPLLKRPMIYYSEPRTSAGRETIVAMGSPLVWWASLAALFALSLRWIRRRHSDAAVLAVIGFGATYVPLLVVSWARPATFLYYMLPSVPFMCLALATIGSEWIATSRKWLASGFAVAAVAVFAFFYPILTGMPLSDESLGARQWFQDCRPVTGTLAAAGWCWK